MDGPKPFFQSFRNTSPFDLLSSKNALLFFYKIEDLYLGSCITIQKLALWRHKRFARYNISCWRLFGVPPDL